MNYSGNMPDWHQYNSPQSTGTETTSTTQNVNANHLFNSSIAPRVLNGLNLSSDGLNKSQNDASYNSGVFQPSPIALNGPNGSENSLLTPMVQMSSCVGTYGTLTPRNPMMETLHLGSSPLDPRNRPAGALNETIAHRSSQMTLNGTMTHMSRPSMNFNGTLGPRSTRMNSIPPNRQGSYIPCKGPCCNQDLNACYQNWDKFGSYPPNVPYRENIGLTGYSTDNGQFRNDFNFRKDSFENKETLGPNPLTIDPCRNFPDYKYRKDSMIPRNYAPPPGLLQNYPMQNYNFTGDYQKYPYTIKDYPKENGICSQTPAILKYQEQSVIVQQKYTTKQIQYQNGGSLENGIVNPNVGTNVSRAQNPYFNSQFTRDFPRDFSRNNADSKLGGNRIQTLTPMHGTYPQYQMYQQKIAMQRFSMENHLREFTSIPGYQSHPKYQEYVLRYKELLRLQQTIEYQSTTQEAPRVISTPINDEIPPINLQFNQHGVLINSDCVPGSFSALQNLVNPAPDSENVQSTNIVDTGNQSLQGSEHFMSCLQNEESLPLHQETFQNQNRFMIQKDFDQERFQERQYKEKSFNILNPDDEEVATINHKNSKDFADKPELDVRQFLANWDESEEEEEEEEEEVGKEEREDNELNDNLQDAVLNNSTSVVIVEYENPSVDTQNSEKFGNFEQEDNCYNKEDTEGNQSEIESANLKNIQDCSIKAQVASDCNAQHLENDSNASDMVQHFEEKNCNDIHCITNSTGNLPAIRTVDNLESETAVTKVQDAYQNMNSSDATVSLEISVAPVSENVQEEETVSPFENSENFQTKSIICETNSGKKDEIDPSVDSSETITVLKMEGCTATNSSSDCEKSLEVNEGTEEHTNAHEAAGLPMFPRNNLEHIENSSLQKQNSFMSEESHNPDDISLPDLPTSECTPFSTTLNTPIYSDSEESSEHVEDLAITTNPIEIIQNSPMLSFTHSPIKIEPYEHLDDERFVQKRSHDSLDFDFQDREHCKKKKSTDAFEDQSGANDRNFEIVDCISKDESTELSNAIEQRDKVPKNIKLFSSTKNNSLMTESNADLNSDIWLPSTSVKCELQDTMKEERNKFRKAVEDSGTDKQLIDMLQSSKNVKDNKSENLSMSNIEMTKHVNRNKDYPTKMTDGKSEEKVNGIKNLELDSKMNKDVYDLQFNIKVNKLLESSSEMNFIHSNHEVCCSLVETNVFHASEDHEKLYTSSDHNKVYVQRVLDQPNFSSNSSMIPLIPGEDFEEPKMPVPPMEGNCLTKIMKNTSPITDLDVLGSDEEKLDKMDDIWVEVECTDKTLDTNLNIESVQNSFQEKSLHSKKLMKVHKSGWKHSKDARNCTSIKKSIKKILKAHKSKSNLNSNNQHLNNVKIHSNSTLIDNSTTFNNDSQNTIINKTNNTIDMFQENSTKDIDFSKKLVAQKSASNNEDNKCVIAFRESSKMQELIKEKGNHINDIATKLLENARIFEPELKKTEDSRSSMETSKERIKLLKEFRKSKNKPNTDQVQDDNKKSKLSVQSIQDDEKGTLESNNMKIEQKCMEIDVLTNSNQKVNESLHCSTKEIKRFEHQDNNKLISSKDSNLIREGKDSSLKNILLTNYRESLEQDTSITFDNHLDSIDKSKRDNNKSVESNLRSNTDSNFEIHSINSNQKIENDVTGKETLSTKEKNQDNVNGLDDLFQIEISAPYVESNCKLEEKSLQQTFVEADSKIEESSVSVLPQSTKCFPCSMKYCALVSKEFSKENATNVSAKLQIHNNNNNSDLATLTLEVHNKCDEIATRSQPELTNIKNATDKCTNRQDDVKETAVKNSLSKSQDDMKRQSENDIDVKDNCYLVNNKEKKKKLSTYLEIESHKVNDNSKYSSGYLVRAEDVVNHEDLVELPNKQEKEDAPLVIQHAVLPLMSTNEKSLQKCLATPGITKQLLYNNKQDDVPAETIKSSKIIKSPKPIENFHDRSFNEIDLNLSSTTNDNVETAKLASSFYLDFDNFDVAPNEDNEADIQMENWKYSKTNFRFEDCEKYKNPDSYVNPIFTSLDALENLNTVPIYTTKDGKITYSPNPKFTYRALILEAREREGYPTIRDSYYAKSNSYDYYDNSKRYKSKYNVTDHEKRRYTEYSNPKIYNESSPRPLNNSKYKNSIGSNGYYHRTVDQIKSNFQNYNGESSKKYNIENTKQQYICMNYKKPIEKFQYRGNKHYRKADDRRSFDVTQSRSKGDTYYDCKKIKTVLPGAEKISSKNCRQREAMTGSVKRYSVNLNESCAIENITTLTSKTKLLDTLYKSSGHDDKILNALKFEIAPFKPVDIFLEDETYGRTLRNCDFVIKSPITSCWKEDRRTNNFALGSKEDVQMVLNDDLKSSSEQTETEVTNGNNSQNVASDKNEISKSLITKKVLETVFEHTRNAITQIEDEQDLTSGKSEGSKSAIIEDVLKTSFEQVKNDIVIDVEQSFASREKNILELATSKKELETIFEEPNSNVKIVEDVQFVSEDLSKSTEDMKKGTMFKLMKNDAKHVKERCFFADECQVLKTTVLEQISEIASQQMNVKIDEAENENILDCEQELRKRKGTLDRKMNDSFTESNTKDPKEQKNKLIICDLRIGNVLPEKRIVEGSDFVEKEQNIISIQSKLSENQNATDSTVKEEAFKLSQKGILEDEDCMEVNKVSNNVFKKECDETHKCKPKNLGEIKEVQLDLGTVDSGTVNTSNIIENNISNQAKFVILKREDPVTFKKAFDKTDECKLEVPKKTEEIKLDPTNVNSGAVNMLNINEDNIHDQTKFFIKKKEVSVLETTLRNYENACFEESLLQTCQKQEHQKLERSNTFKTVSCMIEAREKFTVPLNSYVLEEHNSPLKSDIDIHCKDDKSSNVLEKMTDVDGLPKKELSHSSIQYQHENYTAYSPLKDSDDNSKTIPKIIIKKTEIGSKLSGKSSLSFAESRLDSIKGKVDSSFKLSSHPKIPRMIIRNAGSRPRTPVIEEVPEDSMSPKGEHKFFKVKIKLDEKQHNNEPDHFSKETESSENRIPKMKIKLEDKLPKMIVEDTRMESFGNSTGLRKTIPKMKIKKVRCALPKLMGESLPKIGIDMDTELEATFNTTKANMKAETSDIDCNMENINESFTPNVKKKKEKINKLKVRKQNLRSVTPELSRKRHSLNLSQMQSKGLKKSLKEDLRWCNKNNVVETAQYLKIPEHNINTLHSISEKVPKVIIKRTSSNAEFKCELSKDRKDMIIKTKKWQPKVKLQRSWVLDCMAKMGDTEFALKLVTPGSSNEVSTYCRPGPKRSRWKRILSNQNCQRNFLRSDSTLDLIPVKRKQRSVSNYDFTKFIDSGTFSISRKLIARELNKGNTIQKMWWENFNKIEELRRFRLGSSGIINTTLCKFNENIGISYLLGPTLLNEYCKKMYIKFLRSDFNHSFNRIFLRNALESSETDFKENVRVLNFKILGEDGMTIKHSSKNSILEHTFLNENKQESDNFVNSLSFKMTEVRKRKKTNIKSDVHTINFENIASENTIVNLTESMPAESVCNTNSRSYTMYSEPSKIMDVTSNEMQVCTAQVQHYSDVTSDIFEEQDLHLNAVTHWDAVNSTQKTNDLFMNCVVSVVKDKAECKGTIVDDCIGTMLSDRSTEDFVKKTVITGDKISSETIKNEDLSEGKTLTLNVPVVSNSFRDNDSSVIKVDSSDESQTTIEILPASPYFSQNEIEIHKSLDDCENDRLYSEDAIPTQFELELEIVDNNVIDSLDVPMPDVNESNDYVADYVDCRRHVKIDDRLRKESMDNVVQMSEFNVIGDKNPSLSSNCQLSKDYFNHVEFSKNDVKQLCLWETNLNSHLTTAQDNDAREFDKEVLSSNTGKSLCCSELLVKEVLAAKEALRKCLKKSRNESRSKFKKRPKTAAEKKQGSSFDLSSLMNRSEACSKLDYGHDNSKYDQKVYDGSVLVTNNQCKTESKTNIEKPEKRHSKQNRSYCVRKKVKLMPSKNDESDRNVIQTEERYFSTCGLTNVKGTAVLARGGTMVSLRDSKRLIQSVLNNGNKNTSEVIELEDAIYKTKIQKLELQDGPGKSLLKVVSSRQKIESLHQEDKYNNCLEESMQNSEDGAIKDSIKKSGAEWLGKSFKSYKIPKISRSKDLQKDTTKESLKEIGDKEYKMPVLEPEVDSNYKPNSDRETSRSPPVITNQEVTDTFSQSPADFENKIEMSDCRLSDKEIGDSERESDVTIADIVNKLAYHEKATIKHRRYCTLCERWFPTVARHRRHLTGYQHRHTELTQRRTVHALFMLFTGKPCPKLQLANVVRTDYLLGELTPLQIAVQDVTMGLDKTNASRNQSEENK